MLSKVSTSMGFLTWHGKVRWHCVGACAAQIPYTWLRLLASSVTPLQRVLPFLPFPRPLSALRLDRLFSYLLFSCLLRRSLISSLLRHLAQLQGNRISPKERSSLVYRKNHKRSWGNGGKSCAKNPTRSKLFPHDPALHSRYA